MKEGYITLVEAFTILSEANKNIMLSCTTNEERIIQLKKYQLAAISLGKENYILIKKFNNIFKELFPEYEYENEDTNQKTK